MNKNKQFRNILIIDDEESIRETASCFLESAGHSVTSAKDGDEALHIFSTKRFDLVITDLLMPGKDGFETITEMIKMNPSIRILAISGAISKKEFLDCAEINGIVWKLQKPFYRKELLQRVDTIFADQAV